MRLLLEHGTLTLREVLSYPVGYARDGYPLAPKVCDTIASVEKLFTEEWTDSAAVYLSGGRVPSAGSRFRNSTLAATYQRLLAEAESAAATRDGQIEAARRVFYTGFVAEAIDAYTRNGAVLDATGRRHGSALRGEDLAAYSARAESPAGVDYRGVTVYKTGPSAQGPVLLQQLALLSGWDIAELGRDTAAYLHTSSSAASWPMPIARPGTPIPSTSTSRWTRCSPPSTPRNGGS